MCIGDLIRLAAEQASLHHVNEVGFEFEVHVPNIDVGSSGCWYFLTLTENSASARKYRYSTSPRSIQGIVFSTRNGGVTVFKLVHPGEQEVG